MSVVDSVVANTSVPFNETPVQSGGIVPFAYAITGIAIITVILRLYCRIHLIKKFWWDDAIIIFALIDSIGLAIDTHYAVQTGWGHHSSDIPPLPSYLAKIEKTLFASEVFLTVGTGLTKCSILFFYLRITAGGAHRGLRYATIATLIAMASSTVAITIVICVQCIPISNLWNILLYAERAAACKPYSATLHFFLFQGIINTIGDFVVVLLPAKQILSLNLPKRQKVVVAILFFMGLLACIMGILRISYIANSFSTPDNTWNGAIAYSLGSLEVNTGIICASVPAIKPLVVSLFPKYNGRKSSANAQLALPPAAYKCDSNPESISTGTSKSYSEEVEQV